MTLAGPSGTWTVRARQFQAGPLPFKEILLTPGMSYGTMTCIVETVSNEVVTFESLRGVSRKVAQRREDLIRAGVKEEYIEDFAYDAEHSTGPICGSQERIEAYLTILEVLGE